VLTDLPARRRCCALRRGEQIFANALPADVDAVEAVFDGGVVSEQIQRFVPLEIIAVISESTLQTLDVVGVFDELGAVAQCSQTIAIPRSS
jgi:hypothetical protein